MEMLSQTARQRVVVNKPARHLKELSELTTSCSLRGAVMFSFGIQGALPVLHAGVGCSFPSYYGQLVQSGDTPPFTNTAMCSREIIYGGENRLKTGLHASYEIHKPEMIYLITGCNASIIGDDVDGVLSEVDIDCPIVYTRTAGFDGDINYGFNMAALETVKTLCQAQEVEEGVVNILGIPAEVDFYWKGDITEVKRILNLLGLKVHCAFPGECTLEQIQSLPKASLNVVVDEQCCVEAAMYLHNKFNTPFVKPDFGTIIGPENTFEFFMKVAEAAGLDLDWARSVLQDEYIKAMRRTSQTYAGWGEMIQLVVNTFGVTAEASFAIGLTRLMMCEFGLEPKFINMTSTYPGCREKLDKILEMDGRGFKPIILERADNYEITEAINNEFPAFVLGKFTEHFKADALANGCFVYLTVTYPVVDRFMIFERPIMGFNGAPALMDELMNRMSLLI